MTNSFGPRYPLGRVLMTGASGFIGSRVLEALLGDSGVEEIVVATRSAGAWPTSPDGRAVSHSLDFTRDFCVPRNICTVLHLAGEKRDESKMDVVNVAGTARLARAAVEAGAKNFVYLSSVGVFGAPWRSGAISERSLRAPGNAYERSKDRGEAALYHALEGSGVRVVVLQPSNVIGYIEGRSRPLLGMIRAIRRRHFVWFGTRQAWVNYVDVEDAAAAILAATVAASGDAAYIVNTPAALEDFVNWISEELSVEFPRRRFPETVGHVLAAVGSAIGAVTGNSVALDLPRFRELTNDTIYDPSRLVNQTGFRYPIGAEQMIRRLVRTYVRLGLA